MKFKALNMKLITAIEFSPYNFTDKEYEFPNRSRKEIPDEWEKFWRRCLADSNLQSLTPIEKGSYFVDIETLTDFELEVFVNKELKDIDLDEYEDYVSAIEGGIFIEENGDFIITSNCCGDLGDLTNWENIFSSEVDRWHQLWIGHPWIFYKRNRAFIEFSDYCEANHIEISDTRVKYKISEKWLRNEVSKMGNNQNRLAHRIEQILGKLKVKNNKNISRIMAGVENEN